MQRHLRIFVVCFAPLLIAAALVMPALGQATEGFENGIPPTWTVSSPSNLEGPVLAGTADSTSNLNPTEGAHYGWISNGCSSAAGTTCPNVAATPASYGSLYLGPGTNGLPAGQGLGMPTVETTLTSPSFVFSNSGTISFDVNFITTDGTYDFADYAVVTLIPSGDLAPSPVTLFVANTTCNTCAAVPPRGLTGGAATLNPTTASFTGTTVTLGSPITTYGNVAKFGGGNGGPSAWIHVSYPVSAGSYRLQFLVAHVTDTGYPSALAIDNVSAQPLESETQTLQPGVQAIYPFKNGNVKYKITPSPYSVGNESLTITAVPIVKASFVAPKNFPSETCVPFADYSTDGIDRCVGFQADCSFNGVPNGGDCSTLLYQLLESYNLPPDLPAIGGPDFLVVHGSGCPTSGTAVAQSIFTDYFVTRIDPTTKGVGGGTGSCFEVMYTPTAAPITSGSVSRFVGFTSPVVNTELNLVQAGSTRPLGFQWLDNSGNPVTNLTWCASPNPSPGSCTAPWVNLQYFSISCATDAQISTSTDVQSPGNSGFQNLGGGNYQINWKTQKSWAGTCATVQVTFDNGVMLIPAVGFKFK
jgi:hypothetical protein